MAWSGCISTASLAISKMSDLDDHLTIGHAAERLGLATSALRFYEDKGLISSLRTTGGQRRYPRDVLRRVSFIRAAQQVGLPLAEIKDRMDSLLSLIHI